MKESFEDDLKIDPNQLDVEAGLQGEMFFKWAQKSVEAREAMDRAKFALEVMEAQLSSKIRLDPDRFGVSRVTEGSVSSAVKLHPKYEQAYTEFIEAKANSALMDKAVEAMEQRKRMVELLVTLHGQQYFAGPAVPRNLGQAWKKVKEERDKRVVSSTPLRKRTKGKA